MNLTPYVQATAGLQEEEKDLSGEGRSMAEVWIEVRKGDCRGNILYGINTQCSTLSLH